MPTVIRAHYYADNKFVLENTIIYRHCEKDALCLRQHAIEKMTNGHTQ